MGNTYTLRPINKTSYKFTSTINGTDVSNRQQIII